MRPDALVLMRRLPGGRNFVNDKVSGIDERTTFAAGTFSGGNAFDTAFPLKRLQHTFGGRDIDLKMECDIFDGGRTALSNKL